MVKCQDVTKVFTQRRVEVQAVRGVSLAVGPGEFVAVMGPSGSGKSTLLHLIGGLDTPTSGTISIGETPLSAMSDDALTLFRRRHLGFVFQFFHLLPTLTVEENVCLIPLLDGRTRDEIRARADRLLAQVGLAHRRAHRADELSGGEMQRVAIARALVNDPLLLLADEPTGNLDSRTGDAVLALIRAAVEERGRPTLMVTHDVRAAAFADRVIAMRDGRIVDETRVAREGDGVAPSPATTQRLADWCTRVTEPASDATPDVQHAAPRR